MRDMVETLTQAVRGRVVSPTDPDYNEARAVYNGMHDRRPVAVVQCADAADVMAAIAAGREGGLDLAIRGGGHSVPGFGTVDDGLVIDLAPINNIRVDPKNKVAWVGGGATWGDVDHATYPFGLAVPAGIISTTGVGGLTLGGGRDDRIAQQQRLRWLVHEGRLLVDRLLGRLRGEDLKLEFAAEERPIGGLGRGW